MGSRAFGTTEVIAFLFVFALSLTIVMIFTNQLKKEVRFVQLNYLSSQADEMPKPELDEESYDSLEESIAMKSISYFSHNTTDNPIDYVTIQKLIQNGYIDNVYAIEDSKVECSGYVAFIKDYDDYKTYLYCDNLYKTKGYEVLKEIE